MESYGRLLRVQSEGQPVADTVKKQLEDALAAGDLEAVKKGLS